MDEKLVKKMLAILGLPPKSRIANRREYVDEIGDTHYRIHIDQGIGGLKLLDMTVSEIQAGVPQAVREDVVDSDLAEALAQAQDEAAGARLERDEALEQLAEVTEALEQVQANGADGAKALAAAEQDARDAVEALELAQKENDALAARVAELENELAMFGEMEEKEAPEQPSDEG